MTGLAAIDESGDTGRNGSRFFVMAALVTSRSRHFLKASKYIDNRYGESKYYNSKESTRSDVLTALSQTDAIVLTTIVDKHDRTSEFYGVYGNNLYKEMFADVLRKIDGESPCRSISIMLDRASSISNKDMTEIAETLKIVKVNSCKKYDSFSNKCVQLADFTVGAIREKYENGDDTFYKLIEEKIRSP